MKTLGDCVEARRSWERCEGERAAFDWGLPFLDAHLGRAVPGSLYVVGARTGTGKSYFGLMVLAHLPVPGLMVSVEDSIVELGRRATSLPQAALESVMVATPHARLSAVLEAVARGAEAGARVVVVDYLQELSADTGEPMFGRPDEVRVICTALKAQARELGLVLLLVSQCKRPDPANVDTMPTRYELSDCSSIEKKAEAIIMLLETGPSSMRARVEKYKSGRSGGTADFARGQDGLLVQVVGAPAAAAEELFAP